MRDNEGGSATSAIRLSRRRLVQGAGVGLAAALPTRMLSAADRKHAWELWQQNNPGATPVAVEDYVPVVLTSAEWATLTAVVDRFFPKTDATPGGVETGANIFIDRALSNVYVDEVPVYRTGLAAIEKAVSGGFAVASADAQDTALHDIEAGQNADVPSGFFNTLLSHTRQGMFCDPIHGGNREFMGWDMIGYPGIKLEWTTDDQAINAKVEPQHISVEKYGGRAR